MTILNDPLPGDIDSEIERAVTLHRDDRLDDAAELYGDILKAAPDHPGVLHNLGVVLARLGKLEDAIGLFDRAIDARPDYTYAFVNRGGALQSLGRLEDAALSYDQALSLQANFYPIQRRQALVLLALGRRVQAMECFSHTHGQRRNEDAADKTSRLKLAHDAAQFCHLAAKGVEPERFGALADLYEQALAEIDWPPDAAAPSGLPPDWRDRLGDSYNRPLYRAQGAELAQDALNPALDWTAIANEYGSTLPGIAVIDDLLSPDTLAALQEFLLDSTIWYDFTYIAGFLACYLEDGLACPLLLQIADELRLALPEILGPHALQQGWAFKCMTGEQGIGLHADGGAVGVNFWITPDSANRAPEDGGLVVYRAHPPEGWTLGDYHGDIAPIRQFLAEHDEGSVTVAHAENRALLFQSRFFHESGTVDFAPGYGNHRINITLMFGDGEAEQL